MKVVFSKLKKNLCSERGSEILQVILIAGILLVLVVTLFYPQMQALFNNVINKISTWFDGAGSSVFKV